MAYILFTMIAAFVVAAYLALYGNYAGAVCVVMIHMVTMLATIIGVDKMAQEEEKNV